MTPRVDRTDEEIDELVTEALAARMQRVTHPHRKTDTAMLGLVFAMLVQLGTVVWFASDMKGSVRTLDRVAAKQETTMEMFARQLADLERRASTNETIVNERTNGRTRDRDSNRDRDQ